MKAEYPFLWNRTHRPDGRHKQPCKITKKANSQGLCVIEFRDGKSFIVERGGLIAR